MIRRDWTDKSGFWPFFKQRKHFNVWWLLSVISLFSVLGVDTYKNTCSSLWKVSCASDSLEHLQARLTSISAGCDLGYKYAFVGHPGGKISCPNSFQHQCQRLKRCLDYTNLPSHPPKRQTCNYTVYTAALFPVKGPRVNTSSLWFSSALESLRPKSTANVKLSVWHWWRGTLTEH